MKIKITKPTYDTQTQETLKVDDIIERTKERGKDFIKAGRGEELKEPKRKKKAKKS